MSDALTKARAFISDWMADAHDVVKVDAENALTSILTQVRNEALDQVIAGLEALARAEDEEFENSSHPEIKRNAVMRAGCYRRPINAIRSLKSPG